MPRLSTPLSSSGADEDDLDSPMYDTSCTCRNYFRTLTKSYRIMDEYFGDEAQDIGGNGSEEEPAPATTASDLADGEDSEDDVDQIRNELLKNSAVAPPPKQQGIKRKRGRPTKAETMARKTKTASKSDSSSHRRSGRIVAKVKSETEKAAAAQPAGRGRPKKVSLVRWRLEHLIGTDLSGRCSQALSGQPAEREESHGY